MNMTIPQSFDLLPILPKQQELLRQLLQKFLPNVGVWAFGSRIKGQARATSDLDLVVFTQPAQRSSVFALQEALEESNLPFRVDILIWSEIPENFRTNIKNQYLALVTPTPP